MSPNRIPDWYRPDPLDDLPPSSFEEAQLSRRELAHALEETRQTLEQSGVQASLAEFDEIFKRTSHDVVAQAMALTERAKVFERTGNIEAAKLDLEAAYSRLMAGENERGVKKRERKVLRKMGELSRRAYGSTGERRSLA